MEKTLLSRQDLAGRWGFTTNAIINYESEGLITRIPDIPSPRYALSEILKIENLGKDVNPLSPIERRRLERRIEDLEKELSFYKTKVQNAKMALD